MARPTDPTANEPDRDPDWDARLAYWRRRLGRVRLGVEPVEEQLARYRRATWLLTAIPIGLSALFMTLFSAFGRPDVGAWVSAVLFVPLVALAWLDDALLRRRAAAYLRELRRHESRRAAGAPGGPR